MSSFLRLALGLLVIGLLLPAPVVAHDGVLFGVRPFVSEQELVGGGTSYGLVLSEEDQFLWTCKEAVGASPFWWHRTPSGRLLAGTDQGIRFSDDSGCSWSAPAGPAGELTSFSVAPSPIAADHLLATTGALGVPNHLLESTDGGATWSSLFSLAEAAVWRAVWEPGGEGIVVEAVDSSGVVRLYRSVDAGASWPAEGTEVVGWQSLGLFGVSRDGQSVWATGLSPEGQFSLARIPIDLEGGIEVVRTFPQLLTAFVEAEDELHIVLGFMSYFIWSGVAEDEPVEQDPGVSSCLYGIEDVLWACAGEPMHAQFSRRLPGGDWEELVRLDDIEPRSCPEGSPAAEVCPEVWETIQDSLLPAAPGDDDDSGEPGEGEDCGGCGESSGEQGLALLLLLSPLGFRRRRPLRSALR